MDQSIMQKLAAMLRLGPSANAAVNPAYTNYAREAQGMGQQVLSPQQWAMQQQQAQAQQAMPQAPVAQEQPAQPFRF